MSKTMSKPRKRLTREESRAQTRATMTVGRREHFIRYGLGGAVTEKIAEDASIDAHCHRSEELDSALVATLRGFLHSGGKCDAHLSDPSLAFKWFRRPLADDTRINRPDDYVAMLS
jgi:hypothetical protein